MTRSIKSLFDLKDKVAVVTGGAGWLGTAITEALHELGATVVIASRDAEKAANVISRIGNEENRLRFSKLDITDGESIASCLSKVQQETGRLDVLVNNSYSGSVASMAETSVEKWRSNLDSGLTGPFLCIQTAAPMMKAGGGGSIINIASMYGVVSPDQRIYEGTPFQSSPAYGAAKAGLLQLTRYAACELAKDNVRVNAISPGPFPGTETQKNQKFVQSLASKNPLNRIGEPSEIKGAIAFLASDASSYVTGQNIAIDGGWTVW